MSQKKPPRPNDAWCSQHGMHPSECFDLHYPDAHRKRKSATVADDEHAHTLNIIHEHERRQREKIAEKQARMSRDRDTVIDAKGRFDNHRKGA